MLDHRRRLRAGPLHTRTQLGRRERGQRACPAVAGLAVTGLAVARPARDARTARGFPGKGTIAGDDDGHGDPLPPRAALASVVLGFEHLF
ncbi:hypothetical protein [Xylanimonas protaetiae]|uniref:Uncharacterized protein n=1 Tax=Xylanimonas protaetiae TaxID=2509457 RepID=A0A4P6F5Y2_9MICO|nr:hypothetical protein [Xylanimonas protaetiae]QAY70816.1 hypothetical protein ET471_12935 [Xylanimonas protaetiae]